MRHLTPQTYDFRRPDKYFHTQAEYSRRAEKISDQDERDADGWGEAKRDGLGVESGFEGDWKTGKRYTNEH